MKTKFLVSFEYSHPPKLQDDLTNDLIKTISNLEKLDDVKNVKISLEQNFESNDGC